jgi:hypothetical protein
MHGDAYQDARVEPRSTPVRGVERGRTAPRWARIQQKGHRCLEDRPMPTLLLQHGFKFFFYANEHEPKHVHVAKGDQYAKIELHTFAVRADYMKPKELKKALAIVRLHNHEFEERWDDWQSKR